MVVLLPKSWALFLLDLMAPMEYQDSVKTAALLPSSTNMKMNNTKLRLYCTHIVINIYPDIYVVYRYYFSVSFSSAKQVICTL